MTRIRVQVSLLLCCGLFNLAMTTSASATPPTIEPVREFILENRQVRWMGITPDGTRVVLRSAAPAVDLPALATLFRRQAAGSVAGVLLVIAAWRLVRAARRPQRRGDPYCRRCNYALAGIAEGLCPECGAATSGAGRCSGRGVLRRCRWSLAFAALGLLAAGCVVWLGPPNQTRAAHPRFSSQRVYRGLVRFKPRWLSAVSEHRETIESVDTRDGTVRRLRSLGYTPSWLMPAGFMTPDGVIVDASSNRTSLLFIEASTGQFLREVPFPAVAGKENEWERLSAPNFIFPSGWYEIADLLDGRTLLIAGFESSIKRSDLFRVDLLSGAATRVLEHPSRGGSVPYPSPVFLVPAADPGPRKIIRIVTNPEIWSGKPGAPDSIARLINLETGDVEREFAIGVGYRSDPAFDAQGALCFTGTRNKLERWGADGAQRPLAGDLANRTTWTGPIAVSPDGRSIVLPTQGYHELFSLPEGGVLAKVVMTGAGQAVGLAISRDGGTLALARETRTTNPGVKIGIFDVRPFTDAAGTSR